MWCWLACRIEHKEKVSALTKMEQYMKKYERVRRHNNITSMPWLWLRSLTTTVYCVTKECERTQTLERENAFLVDQVSSMKGETEVRTGL